MRSAGHSVRLRTADDHGVIPLSPVSASGSDGVGQGFRTVAFVLVG